MSVHQKLGIILENKVVQKLMLEKNVLYKKWSPKLILLNEFFFWKNSIDFWHRKMTLKIEFLQFLEGQKELEEVFIKNLFDYKLSIGKCLLTISWSELGITTVDTLDVGRAAATLIYVVDQIARGLALILNST